MNATFKKGEIRHLLPAWQVSSQQSADSHQQERRDGALFFLSG
jgi:hypothetical protein